MLKKYTGYKRLLVLAALSGGVAPVERTATGNPLTFETDLSKPLKSLLIPFTPVQSGSGDPSPQNVRPLVPWDGLKVWNGGKNLFDETAIKNANSILGEDGRISGNANYDVSDFMFIKAGTYSISFDNYNAPSKNTVLRICCYSGKSTSDFIRVAYYGSPLEMDQRIEATFTITSDCYVLVSWRKTHTDIMLVVGSTPSAYEPYKPITETDISFPSPVYGGTLDVVSGVLTVEYGFITLDDSVPVALANWRPFEGTSAWLYSLSVVPSDTTSNSAICDKAKQYAYASIYTGSVGIATNVISGDFGLAIRVPVENLTTEEAIHAYLAENPYHVAYKLATPQEITLTPEQITALKGENTIWSDADGSMTAVYLVSAAYSDSHPVGGLGSGLLGFGSGNPDPDEPGEPDDDTGDDQPADDQQEES